MFANLSRLICLPTTHSCFDTLRMIGFYQITRKSNRSGGLGIQVADELPSREVHGAENHDKQTIPQIDQLFPPRSAPSSQRQRQISWCDPQWRPSMGEATAVKASCTFEFLRRNFRDCIIQVRASNYYKSIRLTMAYASTSWDPYKTEDVNCPGKVQRRLQ